MNTKYIYGGYILTAGVLDNGNAWQGINIFYGECKNGNAPFIGKIAKARRQKNDDPLVEVLQSLEIGEFIDIICTPDGKVVDIRPVSD